jgi:hypothetical protein
MTFLCPCDRNFVIEDNERLSSVGSDDKSRGRGSMWMFKGLIMLYVLQTQQGSAFTTCTHNVFQHYAKDIVPPVKLYLRGLKNSKNGACVCKSILYSIGQLT